MTRSFLPLLVILLGLSTLKGQSAAVDSSRLLRVLTFNIYHGETMLHDFNLDRIADVIRYANADLVALQEVDFRTRRARGMDLATELGTRLGMQALFGKAMNFDGGAYGEGILSRFPIIRSINHPLPYSPGHEPRAALEVLIELPGGDTVAFTGTHLDHTSQPKDRNEQCRRLAELYQNFPYPTLLAGDLNAIPDSEAIGILRNSWSTTHGEPAAPTYPSLNPEKKIDYILFRPAGRWRIHHRQVIPTPIASDHCAYLVVLELEE